jgi:hypothetical protein
MSCSEPASKPASKRYAKFCAFCHAKGLPEAEFTSHFVKDAPGPKGKVCCPELLKNECGYCHEQGHTPNHCPKLKARDLRRRKEKAAATRRVKAQMAFKAQPAQRSKLLTSQNSFAALDMPTQQRAPPRRVKELRRPRPVVPVPSTMNFLAMASKASHEAAEIVALKAQLAKMQAQLAAAVFVGEQTMEQTAEGEAFFDNDLDAEDAVASLAVEQPALVRQGAFGALRSFTSSDVAATIRTNSTRVAKGAFGAAGTSAPLPETGHGIALPDSCDLDADFGAAPSGDGWGADED